MWVGFFGFLRQHILHLGATADHVPHSMESCWCCRGPGTREGCATGRAAMQTAGPLGSHDPAGLMVPEVSVGTDRDAVGRICQPLHVNHRPGPYNLEVLPSSADNYSPLEKHLLV